MKNFAVIILVLLVACTPTKVVQLNEEPEEDTTICDNRALLLDYTANQNCGFLFQLSDGTKLLPSEMPETDIPFIDQQTVLIGYKKYDEITVKTNSKCGIEDMVAEITCIRKYEDPNDNTPKTHEECEPVKNVFLSKWMSKVSQELRPQKIYEYDYSIGFLYLFNANGVNHLYDCLGNKMCSTDDNGDCKSLIATLGKGRVIQVLRN